VGIKDGDRLGVIVGALLGPFVAVTLDVEDKDLEGVIEGCMEGSAEGCAEGSYVDASAASSSSSSSALLDDASELTPSVVVPFEGLSEIDS